MILSAETSPDAITFICSLQFGVPETTTLDALCRSGHGWSCALAKNAHNNSAESIEKLFIDVIFEVKRSVRNYPVLDRSMEIQEMGGFKKNKQTRLAFGR